MKYTNFLKILAKFNEKYSDIIDEFEATNRIVLEDYSHDIFNIFENILKINKNIDIDNLLLNSIIESTSTQTDLIICLNDVVSKVTLESQEISSTQRYFREVNNVYEKYNNDYNIEYCEENRNRLIEMNLKSVIAIAKNYQGLGLSFEELISAGNLGLCVAWDKYDPNRAKLKDNMLAEVNNLPETFNYNQAKHVMNKFLTYGDVLDKFDHMFKTPHNFQREDMTKWIKDNIVNAKFNSIANLWIRAYILIEIDNYSRIVRKPKSEIYKDVQKNGAYQKEQIVDIDSPIGDDGQCTFGDMIANDDDYSPMDSSEAYDVYKNGLNKLLDGVKSRDRSVFLKKFGIGLPRPLLPREIAQQEGLSIARVSQIFQYVIEKMQANAAKYNINIDELFEASRKLN
jgi:DNA-directed RNA polymerase sigma subunit (sigma70/sigma32)